MSAIPKDAATTNDTPAGLTADSASELFLKKWGAASDEKTPADHVKEDKGTSAPVDAEEQPDDEELLLDDEEGIEDPDNPEVDSTKTPKFVDDDESMVKVAVDGQELTVSVKDLKRLYGQEASLTRKSMELATRRKEAEEVGTYYATGLARLVEMAEEEYRPYANIDFLVAAKELNAEELKALREEANAKYQKYQFLTNELSSFTQQHREQQAQLMQAQAAQTIQELSDPQKGIPNWGPQLYEEVGNYAISKGMRPEVFASILDAPSLRVIYDAYRYDKARKMTTKKKAASPQKVLKSSASPDSGRFNGDKTKASLSKLRQTGSRDDAVSALLAKWGVE